MSYNFYNFFVQAALRKSEAKRAKAEAELHDAKKVVRAQEEEMDAVVKVKGSLKAKLKECKSKLEQTVGRFEEERAKVHDLKEQSSLVLETETVALKETNREVLRTAEEYRERLEDVEARLARTAKELTSCKSVCLDQKETLNFVKAEKDALEEEHRQNVHNVTKSKRKLEAEVHALNQRITSLGKEGEAAGEKLRSKDEKLAALETVLAKLESKIVSRPLHQLPTAAACHCAAEVKAAKDDLSMQKIEVRLLERKNRELEERIKWRVSLAKEEKVEKDKAEAEAKECREKLKAVEKTAEEATAAKERASRRVPVLESQVDELKKKVSALQLKEEETKTLQYKLERVERQLEEATTNVTDARKIKADYDALKAVCLEQQDQATEYEQLLEKMQAGLDAATKAKERLQKEVSDLSTSGSQLRIEKNELRSKLIFAETQLKEQRDKRADVETLFENEARNWSDRLNQATSASDEQTCALSSVTSQLESLAARHERVAEESEALREQNLDLKEELAVHLTNVQSLKESNLKLHAVMEEMLAKIERRNAEIARLRDELAGLGEDVQRRDVENTTHIAQLKKLVEHLRTKNEALETVCGGKGGKGKKRAAAEAALLATPAAGPADDYQRRMRTPSKTPLRSPPRKLFK